MPPIDINNLPEESNYLCIIIDDPDAPGSTFTHLICWDITASNSIGEGEKITGTYGENDFGNNQYNGPCPPKG